MSDNITLSDDDEEFTREDVTTLLLEVMDWVYAKAHRNRPMTEAEQKVLDDIRTHLAAEPTKPEPVAVVGTQSNEIWKRVYENWVRMPLPEPAKKVHLLRDLPVGTPLYAAPPATHPGYIIGSHWLETAYSRICAGEAEADVLRDIGLVREEAFLTGVAHLKAEDEALRRDAERYEWLLNWLRRTGLLSLKTTRIDTPESYGDWFVLRKPHIIDGDSLLGYGKTEDAAIDAAMKEDKR